MLKSRQEKGLWRRVGHEPIQHRTEASINLRKHSAPESRSASDARSHREYSTLQKDNANLENPMSGLPPVDPRFEIKATSDAEEEFLALMDNFKATHAMEENEMQEERKARETTPEIQLFPKAFRMRQRTRQMAEVTPGALKSELLQFVKESKTQLRSIRSAVEQGKKYFMSSINELTVISAVLFSASEPESVIVNQASYEEDNEYQEANSFVQHRLFPQQVDQCHQTDIELTQSSAIAHLTQELAALRSYRELNEAGRAKLETEISHLRNQIAAACQAQYSAASDFFSNKYEGLLKQTQELYTNLARQNSRTIEQMRRELEFKTEEVLIAQRHANGLEEEHARALEETCHKRFKAMYEKSERERMRAEEQMHELARENQTLRESQDRFHKQGFKIFQQNDLLKREMQELEAETNRLRGSLEGEVEGLRRENKALAKMLEERDFALQSATKSMRQMKAAHANMDAVYCRDPHIEPTEGYRSKGEFAYSHRGSEDIPVHYRYMTHRGQMSDAYTRLEANEIPLMSYQSRAQTVRTYTSPDSVQRSLDRRIRVQGRIREHEGRAERVRRPDEATNKGFGMYRASNRAPPRKEDLMSPVASKANRLCNLIKEELRMSKKNFG